MKEDNLPVPVKKENLPKLKNPLHDLISGNMPGLPNIIQNSMPLEMPRASFKQGSVSLFFGNIKRNQLVKSVKAEAEIATQSRIAVHEKLEMVHELITFSARTQNTFQEYEHQQHMRRVAEDQAALTTRNMELQNNKMEIEIYKLQAEATEAGHNANISELDYMMRKLQYEKMMKEMENGE